MPNNIAKHFTTFVASNSWGMGFSGLGLALWHLSKGGGSLMPTKRSLKDFVILQCTWVFLYYFMLFRQGSTHSYLYMKYVKDLKTSKKKDDDKAAASARQERRYAIDDFKHGNLPLAYQTPEYLGQIRAVNRAVGNMVEQSLIFLPLLWTNYLIGDNGKVAVPFAWCWLLSRSFYPVFSEWTYKSRKFPYIFLSTFPGYAALFGMLMNLMNYAINN